MCCERAFTLRRPRRARSRRTKLEVGPSPRPLPQFYCFRIVHATSKPAPSRSALDRPRTKSPLDFGARSYLLCHPVLATPPTRRSPLKPNPMMQRSLQQPQVHRQEQQPHLGRSRRPLVAISAAAATRSRPMPTPPRRPQHPSHPPLWPPPPRAAVPEASAPTPPPPPSDPAPAPIRDGYRAAAVGAALTVLAALADHEAVDAHPQVAMAVVFAVGMAGVTLEELWGFSKAGVSLLMAASLWTIRATTPGVSAEQSQLDTAAALSATSDLIFFLLSAMTVVEVVDAHGGFDGLAQALRPGGRRRTWEDRRAGNEGGGGGLALGALPSSPSSSPSSSLLQQRAGLAAAVTATTFFMSALLDNLTTTIVVLSVVNRALADDEEDDDEGREAGKASGGEGEGNGNSNPPSGSLGLDRLRLLLGGLVVIAANAGGAWTPIGDVTTTLLWVQGHLSPWPTMRDLFLPSLACTAAPLALLAVTAPELKGPVLPAAAAAAPLLSPAAVDTPNAVTATAATTTTAAADRLDLSPPPSPPSPQPQQPPRSRRGGLVLGVGVGALVFAPVFREATHLPASFGALAGLAALWIVTDALHWGEDRAYPRVNEVLSRVDVGGALFFAGVLLSVGALEAAGALETLAEALRAALPPGPWALAASLGVASAVVDNVPLVAAASSMFGGGGGGGGGAAVAGAAAAGAAGAAGAPFVPMDDALWQLTAYCAGTGGSLLIVGSASGIALMSLMPGAKFSWYLKRVAPGAAVGYAAGLAAYWVQQGGGGGG
jgi:Na+/H+ antiporter NhaD/arsenite permease-like protein